MFKRNYTRFGSRVIGRPILIWLFLICSFIFIEKKIFGIESSETYVQIFFSIFGTFWETRSIRSRIHPYWVFSHTFLRLIYVLKFIHLWKFIFTYLIFVIYRVFIKQPCIDSFITRLIWNQTDVLLVPNQPENGKYNLISV